jgi:hypothetical protein
VPKPAYKPTKDGSWQYPTMRIASFVSCCDCGLVHRQIIQITPDDFAVRARVPGSKKRKWRYGRRVRIKVSRDYRKTAQVRRGMAKRKELYTTSDGWYVLPLPINARKRK